MSKVEYKTDPFALIAFGCGVAGFWILPEIFAPIGLISGLVAARRFKENKEIGGKIYRITGAILNSINIFYILYEYGAFRGFSKYLTAF